MMQFSIAPKKLDVSLFDNPSNCIGGCDSGYAVSDVYFAEVCVTSFVCRNRAELFNLDYGDLFECDLDEAAYMELGGILEVSY